MIENVDHYFMNHALSLAKKAERMNEVPVGAVLVLKDQIIGEGWNCPISSSDPTAHAEMIALREGAKNQINYRLLNTTLYVTLEPCVMCTGAMIHARIKRLVFGAKDPKTGAICSFARLLDKRHNHSITWVGELMKAPCADVLKQFFKKRR